MAEPFIGQIMPFGGNFAIRSWAMCNGQLLAISQNTALFSILGTTFGGNGTTTFGLPDLRGRVPIHWGTGPGLSAYNLGQVGGVESVTLNVTQMPAHNHNVNANSGAPGDSIPNGNLLASSSIYKAGAGNAVMATTMIANAGGNLPHENRQPYLAVTWLIALQGIFPSRN